MDKVAYWHRMLKGGIEKRKTAKKRKKEKEKESVRRGNVVSALIYGLAYTV